MSLSGSMLRVTPAIQNRPTRLPTKVDWSLENRFCTPPPHDIMPPPQEKIKALDDSERDRISDISMQIRQAIRSALPAPPEQFFTLMVPAKVVNLDVSFAFFGCCCDNTWPRMLIWNLFIP